MKHMAASRPLKKLCIEDNNEEKLVKTDTYCIYSSLNNKKYTQQ